jgi:hypothetical protein
MSKHNLPSSYIIIIVIIIATFISRLMDERHQHECQDAEAGFQMRIMMLVDGYQDLIRLRDAQTERLEVRVVLPSSTHCSMIRRAVH